MDTLDNPAAKRIPPATGAVSLLLTSEDPAAATAYSEVQALTGVRECDVPEFQLTAGWTLRDRKASALHNVYLSVRSDGLDGTGLSQECPRDASSAAKLQAIYDERAALPTTFHYAPGVYQTNGWTRNVDNTAFSNHHHQGSGIDITTLQLVKGDTVSDDGRIFCNGTGTADIITNFAVRDMTLDCNAEALSKWTAGAGGTVLAILLYSAVDMRLERCKIKGFGTKGGEVFPVYTAFTDSSIDKDPNIQYKDCIWTEPATGNAAEISINVCTCAIIFGEDSALTAAGASGVYNCQFVDCESDFSTSIGVQAPIVDGCYFTGITTAIYLEMQTISFAAEAIRISNNRIQDVYARGIFIFGIDPHSNQAKVRLIDNTIILEESRLNTFGIQCTSQLAEGIHTVFATGNEIRFRDGELATAVATSPRGFSFNKVKNLHLAFNQVSLYNDGSGLKEMEKQNITNDTSDLNRRSNGFLLP